MKGKIALVTGAASGLVFATAKAFGEAGASIVLADWDEDAVNIASQKLSDKGFTTLAIACDVSDEEQVKSMVEKTVKTFGRIDAAYNNAGVQNALADAADQTREDFDRVMNINLRGVWSCMKYELQQMRKQKSGGIRINTICPGLIHTAMADQMIADGQGDAINEMLKDVPIGRLGRSEEIANAVLWLCSDSASLVIGHTLVVDGGYSIH